MNDFSFEQEIVGHWFRSASSFGCSATCTVMAGSSRPSTQPRGQTDEKEGECIVGERRGEKKHLHRILPSCAAAPEDVPKVLRGDFSRSISGFDVELAFGAEDRSASAAWMAGRSPAMTAEAPRRLRRSPGLQPGGVQ